MSVTCMGEIKRISRLDLNYGHMALFLPPANEVWGKVIFLHQFVILFTGGVCGCSGGVCVVAPGGHAWLLQRGACVVAWGGMCGCSRGACVVLFGEPCVVLLGGCAWFYLGGCAWFYSGGMHGFIQGGVCGFIRGACMVLFGGACVVFSVFSDTMRYGQSAGGTHPTGMHSCFINMNRKHKSVE